MDNKVHSYQYEADAKQPSAEIMVWDLPLRLFHWSMVWVVCVAGVTGFLAPEWWLDIHILAGYALGILLAFRFIWGFVGSYYSRFISFPLMPGGVYCHLRKIISGKPDEHIGHNPAGAWMIVILLLLLILLTLTGLFVLGGQENLGPLAFAADFQTGKMAEEIHEIAAWGLLGAIAIHLLGVFAETRIFRHSVLPAMITGKKMMAGSPANLRSESFALRGGLLFVAITALLISGGMVLANAPPSGWRPVKVPEIYKSECGDCHNAHHPSLRTRASWLAIMKGLPDHYGEDASLDDKATAEISSYLGANHAGTFDTEAAWRAGRPDTPSLRITDVPYWKHRHQQIDPSVFKLPAVGSKINCNNCHKDADEGRFDDINIHLPIGDAK